MRQRIFMFWNVLGAFGWGLEWLGAGYLFARSLNLAQIWLSRVGMLLAILLAFSLLLWWFKRVVMHKGRQWLGLMASVWRSIRTAVADHPEVIRMAQTHPRVFTFLSARLDRSRFQGLTLLGLAFVYVAILFTGIVEDLITTDPIIAFDHSLAQFVSVLRSAEVIRPFIWITSLGMGRIVILFLSATIIVLWLNKNLWMSIGLLTSTLGAAFFTYLGKLAFHRPRPVEAVLAEHSWSFPSGHTTVAVAFYGFLGYLLIRFSSRWKYRVNVLFAVLILAFLIGLSRVILGVHYLSDVLAGYLIGMLWLIIGVSLNEWLLSTGRFRPTRAVSTGARRLSAIAVLVAIAGYIVFTAGYHPPLATAPQTQAQALAGDLVATLKSQLPPYTETALGQRQQPLGLILRADSNAALTHAFQAAGWKPVRPFQLPSITRLLKPGKPIEALPLTPTFWNQRIAELSFEHTVTTAHGAELLVVHIWKTAYTIEGRQVLSLL